MTLTNLQKNAAKGILGQLTKTEFSKVKCNWKCFAEHLAEKAVARYGIGAGFDVKIEERPRTATETWKEHIATGPERVTNRNSAFEESMQRGKERVWTLTLECIKPDAFLAVLSAYDAYAPDNRVGPFDEDAWQRARNISPIWILKVSVSEWVDGIMTSDGFVPADPDIRVSFTTWALPTIGERAQV